MKLQYFDSHPERFTLSINGLAYRKSGLQDITMKQLWDITQGANAEVKYMKEYLERILEILNTINVCFRV